MSVLAGGIIGAGAFSLPYVVSQSGLIVGFVLLALATVAYSVIHLMYADVLTGTTAQHRFVGYVERYLGKGWKYLAVAMAVVEMVFILTIYLVLSVSFFHLIFPGFSVPIAIFLFWLFGALTTFSSLKQLELSETVVTVGILAIIGALFAVSIPSIETLSAVPIFTSHNLLLPLSAIFFALSGRVAVPSLVNALRSRGHVERGPVRRAVIIGTVIPAVVYAIFIISVLALSGTVSPDAVTGLLGAIPAWLAGAIGVLGLLTLWSSYILVGRDVSDTLRFDLDVPRWLRFFVVLIVPLVLYALGFDDFIGLVSLIGGIFLSLEGIFVVLLWRSARKQRKLGGLITVSRFTLLFLWVVFTAALIGVITSLS